MWSVMQVQEAVLGMLYVMMAGGCNIADCLEWMLDLCL